jgi:hypothetical protein
MSRTAVLRTVTAFACSSHAAVARHPNIVPGEHDHRDGEDRGIEKLLTHASQGGGESAGKERNDASASDACKYASDDPPAATRNATRARHDDADDQPASKTSRKTMMSGEHSILDY